MNSAWLWSRVKVAIKKTEMLLVTKLPTCWKPDSCFWFVGKDKKKDNEFVPKSLGIKVRIVYM